MLTADGAGLRMAVGCNEVEDAIENIPLVIFAPEDQPPVLIARQSAMGRKLTASE
jgi:hypothetical protein